jgi:cytochrome c oxidase subunit 2
MKSFDVIHSFWVPAFAGKRDVFPNRETRLWFTADTTGAFPGACAEFCGTQHGRMDYYLMVDTPADFDAWVTRRHADSALAPTGLPLPAAAGDTTPPAPEDPQVAQGRQLFMAKGCIACHTSNSTNPAPMLGPNLSGVGSRKMIAAGWLPNTDANLARWVHDPQGVKEGVAMKLPVPVSEAEAQALVAYLRTKR